MASEGLTALGLVVNPKLKKPLLVESDASGFVRIRTLTDPGWPKMGRGYYDDDYDAAAHITGMPRVHTPDGVEEAGMGYGTSLYTALCLAAHLAAEGQYKIHSYAGGDGICSQVGKRSSAAEEWWTAARRRRLAYRSEYEVTDENVDATSELADALEGREYEGGTITSVNDIKVDVTKTEEADVYPWENATEKNLVVAGFVIAVEPSARESLYKLIMAADDSMGIDVEPEWILALDVRGLTLEAMNLLGVLGQTAGVTEKELAALRMRWELGLDPDQEIQQQQLPFRPNSAEGRVLAAGLEEAAALRAEAGWAAVADLP